MISSGKLSPSVILNDITDSSDIPERFVAATETLNRAEAPLMMQTVKLLTDVVEAHRQMQRQINTDFVDTGTSWPTALSKLLTSLGDMMRGHITDSISLLSILNRVYMKHIDYVVTGLMTQLQECDGLTAEAHVIVIRRQSMQISTTEVNRLQMLLGKFEYLRTTLSDFEPLLKTEWHKSSPYYYYFPNQLIIGECRSKFYAVVNALSEKITWFDGIVNGEIGFADYFAFTTSLRSDMARVQECLMFYKEELESFKEQLTSTLNASFNYEPPTTSLLKFNMDSQWLDSVATQYIANKLSKLDIATALHTNGSEVLTNADRLYSDIELSLFSKVSNVIDEQETGMVSFYSDLLQRVTSLQRYMFPNDTTLEDFMRRLSIWRIPIVNFQTSQVLLLNCCNITAF